MKTLLSLEGRELLKNMQGAKIIRVRRQLFRSDFDLDDFEQSADGPLEVEIDNGAVVHFQSDTESLSVVVGEGRMPCYGDGYSLVDLTGNEFWQKRVGREILKVLVVRSFDFDDEYLCEFGVEVYLSGGIVFFVEYVSQSESPDMIRVIECYSGAEERIIP